MGAAGQGQGEDGKARVDRELIELLNELRVALPGVQVLFAFLLTLPFTQRFAEITTAQRDVYFASFLAAAAASALLIAPSAYHRLHFRGGAADKERMLLTANRLAIGGTAFLAVAISGTVFVVTDVLFRWGAAALVTGAVAGLFGWFWYGLPLTRRPKPSS
jgi:uncharacterized protein DUF6328